mmetsp:Transcript_32979/g.71892  ORF Transcript_32979/g.71892 Transcript_32979/m.71892 type:complete len:166 (-) Transcript_32979:1594-2091(-)
MFGYVRNLAHTAHYLRVVPGPQGAWHLHSLSRIETSRQLSGTVQAADTIFLNGLTFHGFHGVLPEENVLGQKFVIDLTMRVDLRKAGETDELDQTVNYAEVFRQVKTIVEGPPRKLIEAVAEDIAKDVLTSHGLVQDIMVRVKKPHVALEGVIDTLGVEIWRKRG